MSVVVTGATGQLGTLVVQHLLAGGMPAAEVTAVGRDADKLAALAATGVRTAVAAYEDAPALVAAFEGAETVLLVSGSEVGRRVEQHRQAIDAARTAGVRRVVYTSAPQADTTDLVLAPEHKATEEILRSSGLAWTLLRNNWYTENYVDTVATARQTGTVLTSAGDGRVASATRDDYAAAAAAVLLGGDHDGKVYELSGDTAWSFDDLAAAASDLIDAPVAVQQVTSAEHGEILRGIGLDEGTAGFVVRLDADIRDGALGTATSDLSTLIGRSTTSLAEGLRAATA